MKSLDFCTVVRHPIDHGCWICNNDGLKNEEALKAETRKHWSRNWICRRLFPFFFVSIVIQSEMNKTWLDQNEEKRKPSCGGDLRLKEKLLTARKLFYCCSFGETWNLSRFRGGVFVKSSKNGVFADSWIWV